MGRGRPSSNKIWAAQKRSAPVKEIEENPGTNEIEFDLIELKPANIVQVMGGTTSKTARSGTRRRSASGWRSGCHPFGGRLRDRSCEGVALASPKGKYDYSDVMKIHCKMTFLLPDDPEASPYSIDFAPNEEEEVVG